MAALQLLAFLTFYLLSPFCIEAKVLVKRQAGNNIDIMSPATPRFGVSEAPIPPIDRSAGSADCAGIRTVFLTDPHHSWGGTRHVLHVNFTGETFNYHTIVYDRTHKPWANDFDPDENEVYWTNIFDNPASGSVEREHRNGSGTIDLIHDTGLQEPYGIAIDHGSSQLFVTDASGNKIESSDLDGGSRTTVVPGTFQSRPCAIATDSLRGFIFWTDCGSSPRVVRANRDGSGLAVIASTNLVKPYAIAVDSAEGKVYWGDGSRGVIERADMDGSNRESFLTIQGGSANMYGLDVDETHVYFTDWVTPSCLHVVSKASPAADYTVVGGVPLLQYLTDVRVYGHCPTDYSRCAVNPCLNGGACQPLINSGFACTCAAGFTGRVCELPDVPTTTPAYGNCEDGWHQLGSSCFKLSESPGTREAAEATCESEGMYGRLAIDKNPATHDFLSRLVPIGRCDIIGLDDIQEEGVWRHGDGTRASPPFEPWKPGTWNTALKDCVGIDSGGWVPVDCNEENYFICELPLIEPTTPAPPVTPCDSAPCENGGTCRVTGDDSYICDCTHNFSGYTGTNCELSCPSGYQMFAGNGKCYHISTTAANVDQAATNCDGNHNGKLACVKDLATHNFLKSIVKNTNYWIGLDDRQTEGSFVWSDGEALGTYQAFFNGHGYNRAHNDCVYLNRGKSFQWVCWQCTRRIRYICQTNPV
ncbi:PREDICTED: pro-epidermal growth factor-like [Branchiostoma belcheri]|uniref:Pro-epidermal growth factor-like n=1 Tax=Branchiostoma belcheri TaxID=7741 RepID=A0A6P5AER3_BRABE|nr:PREDICTED: pro-epidermal growth factor-like [Branchiostoma belcheri]